MVNLRYWVRKSGWRRDLNSCLWRPGDRNTSNRKERRKEMFYLTTHSTHFIYSYMASDIWLRTILIAREETHCRHIGYSFQLTARVLLYAPSLIPSHRQDSTYHSLGYTSRGALAGTRNSSMGPPHEGSIRRSIVPWANALTTELHLAPPPTGPVVGHIVYVNTHTSHLAHCIRQYSYLPPSTLYTSILIPPT